MQKVRSRCSKKSQANTEQEEECQGIAAMLSTTKRGPKKMVIINPF
jgi:hypothetical protein